MSGDYNSSANVVIVPDGAGILAQRNGTNAQTLRVYNTYTSSTSFENLQLKAVAAAAYQIGSAIGSAGGTNRAITFGHWNTAGAFTGTAGITTAGRFSDNAGFTEAEIFGVGATGAAYSTLFGYGAASTGSGVAVVFGGSGSAGSQSAAFGYSAVASGSYSVALGNYTTSSFASSIALGRGAVTGKVNQLVIGATGADGSAIGAISEVSVGGNSSATPYGSLITSCSGLGTNIAGASFTLAGGKGTGTGAGGSLIFQTAPAGSAGSTLNSLVTRLTIDSTGLSTFAGPITLTQPVSTTGSPTAFTVTGAAHTTLALSTEATDVNFNLSRTVQFATGALTTQRAMRIQAPTYGFVGASTITTASTLSISGPPVAGTNATISTAFSLYSEGGLVGSVGDVVVTTAAGAFGVRSGPGGSNRIQMKGGSGLEMAAACYVAWGPNSTNVNSLDVYIYRDAAGTLALRNAANTQSFGVYGTWTSTTSYERINVRGKASANFEIGPENGELGGTLRGLTLGGYTDGSATIMPWLTFDKDGNATFTNSIIAPNFEAYLTSATFSTTTLNGIPIGDNATFSVLNDGTDFTIESDGSTHSFKMPDASETARGLITIGTQTIAGEKTFSSSITASGDITASGQITNAPPASVTLATNGQFSVEMTSNTAGNLVYRGSDGTTRRAALVFV